MRIYYGQAHHYRNLNDQELMTEVLQTYADNNSDDMNTKVACMVITQSHIVVGSNQLPEGVLMYPERIVRPTKTPWLLHAEQNVLSTCARVGIKTHGATLHCTMYPCSVCTRSLIQAGMERVVTVPPDWSNPRWAQEFEYSETMLREAGILVSFVQSTPPASLLQV